MKRPLFAALLLAIAHLAQAHFVWIIPSAVSNSAEVIMSETLSPAPEVDISVIADTKLNLRSADGHETPLKLMKDGNEYSLNLKGSGTQIIYGITDLGMLQHGQNKPSVLIYHPKAIVGDAFAQPQVIGGNQPIEIVPSGKPGAVVLQLLVHGKPQPNSEVTILMPGGSQKKLRTNAEGQTEALTAFGTYGVWARNWEPVSGERDGKHFDETRHYATLVFTARQPVNQFATLPEATASFGEAVSDGWLYVYGGHIAHTHNYSTESVSGRFERLNLKDGKTWEDLPGGPPLQGLNLAVYEGKIYRVGGMEPRNKPGASQATFSVPDCARFNPATKQWETLPPLPEPRSSHDVAVVGNQLIVVGGWDLKGPEGQTWADTLDMLDLSAEKLEWKTVKQPFKRRALIAAADDHQMYVVGGMNDKGEIERTVSIYDPQTDQWTNGPNLPGEEVNGFSPAACMHDGVLYVSVADGSLYRLDDKKWQLVGESTPRVAHRISFWNNTILIAGGAAKGNNSNLIESIPIK